MGEGASRTREIEGESSNWGRGEGQAVKTGGGGKMKLGVMYVYEGGK